MTRGPNMLTVRRLYDVPGPRIGESVEMGTVETADELRELLTDRIGRFTVTGVVTVRLDLEAPITGDSSRAFVEQIVASAEGNGPSELMRL